MKTDPNAKLPKGAEPVKSLTQVLGQSEHVKELMEESAKELLSVNKALKQETVNRDPLPAVENALEKNEAVAQKVKETTQELTDVIRALKDEVRDRNMLDHQFAAVTEQEEAARHAAFHDALTGLPNRALFDNRLEHGFAQAKRHGWILAVMFMDLDGFKNINDTHGHDAGDGVLQAVAQRLKENTRGGDTVSRVGGDEFLFLLTEIQDERNIALIAEKILKAIQAPCKVSVRDLEISLCTKASIGISLFPKDGATAKTLVESADKAMYRAKKSKSGYAFAQQEKPHVSV
jgi:diguanylate cyclase (GGDEF)-like protein